MLRISAPATSANLSVGFDTLGIALDLFNVFLFEDSDEFIYKGFAKHLSNDHNLVVTSYVSFVKQFGDVKELKKVKVTLEKQEIPLSRGLGSSASCILAGVFAANHFHHLHVSFDECVEFAAALEGHSDNVFACAYGGLTASLQLEDQYHYDKFKVNGDYKFTLMIPETIGSTKMLRSVLPKKVDFKDAVNNLSRMVFVPRLFEEVNIKRLKDILSDKLHEVYRYPTIPSHEEIQDLSKDEELVVCISGSGPTVLLISTKDINYKLTSFENAFEIKKVNVSKGISLEVVK